MSEPLRIALVAEGPTEREVITAALDAILAPRSFVLTQVQPEATRPDMGTGWGGVLKWCHQLAQRAEATGGGALEADPTLFSFDGVVLQLDADVATHAYSDLRPPYDAIETAARGWQALPCAAPCPPAPPDRDALHAVLLSWVRPAHPGPRTVVCLPSMNTGAWQAAARLPEGHALLDALECNVDIEAGLQQLPKALKVDKRKRESRLRAADAVRNHWSQVAARCSRARRFEQDVRTAWT